MERFIVAAVAVALLLCTGASGCMGTPHEGAETTFGVRGVVRSEDGHPLAGVELASDSGSWCRTHDDGEYKLGLYPGRHLISVTYQGQRYSSIPLSLVEDDDWRYIDIVIPAQ